MWCDEILIVKIRQAPRTGGYPWGSQVLASARRLGNGLTLLPTLKAPASFQIRGSKTNYDHLPNWPRLGHRLSFLPYLFSSKPVSPKSSPLLPTLTSPPYSYLSLLGRLRPMGSLFGSFPPRGALSKGDHQPDGRVAHIEQCCDQFM
jgi:hypothetical protein